MSDEYAQAEPSVYAEPLGVEPDTSGNAPAEVDETAEVESDEELDGDAAAADAAAFEPLADV